MENIVYIIMENKKERIFKFRERFSYVLEIYRFINR